MMRKLKCFVVWLKLENHCGRNAVRQIKKKWVPVLGERQLPKIKEPYKSSVIMKLIENQSVCMQQSYPDAKRERLLEALYDTCQNRSITSEQALDELMKRIGLIAYSHIKEQAMDIIRPYKLSGKNLEETLDKLYSVLYPTDELVLDNNLPLTWENN